MGNRYGRLVFGRESQRRQELSGSFVAYGAHCKEPDEGPDSLSGPITGIIREAHHFYLATVSPSGWPYIQHRGGPPGFVHILDEHTLGFADYSGNKQFVTVGNIAENDRAALFFMDYARKRRVKILGRIHCVEKADDPHLLETLATVGSSKARSAERSFLITVEGIDANCTRNITPLWNKKYIDELTHITQRDTARARDEVEQLRQRISELEAQLKNQCARHETPGHETA